MPNIFGLVPMLRRAEAQPDLEVAQGDGASHIPATSGATLLPRPVASIVSFVTQSTSLSLRVGTFFGGVAIDGARATTLTGLELSRAVIEGVLTRAGRDVATRSSGEHGRVEAESILERSLAALHKSVTSASFFVAATFHFSSTTLSSASNMSQALLSTLDAILGSTESSRAIAAIITLIRREFRNPRVESMTDDNIGVGDLLIGTVGFAMLQRWGRKNTERQIRTNGGDEAIWDVVILDNGVRADVVGMHQIELTRTPRSKFHDETRRSSFISPGNDEEAFDAVRRPASRGDIAEKHPLSLPPGDHQMSDDEIRLYIMKQLPQGCRASIKTDLVTARTITVDIYDDDSAEIAAPPGTMVIEERFRNDQCLGSSGGSSPPQFPKHTVVFRTAFNKSQSADVRLSRGDDISGIYEISSDHGDQSPYFSQGITITDSLPDAESTVADHRHAIPQDKPIQTIQTEIEDDSHQNGRLPGTNGLDKSSYEPTPLADSNSSKRHRTESTRTALNEADTISKGSFGKGSLTRIAQKVKPASVERSGQSKRLSVKEKSNTPPVHSVQRSRGSKGSVPERKSSAPKQSPKPTAEAKPEKPPLPSKARVSSAANRGSPRSPLQSSRLSVPSTVRGSSAREMPPERGPMPEFYAIHEKNEESFMKQADAYSTNVRPRSSADHTGLPASTILLSSFVDPAGGSNAAGETETGFPLVHYLFLDHESKAVVLTLRGTWGFEDILTDMTCDYDDLEWQGKSWKVHKGMHASAQRLLMGGGGKVMITIRAALEEFPDYGVVLCGHSLGGGVAALLATMISEPTNDGFGTSFVTASYQATAQRLLLTGSSETNQTACFLPSGRPIHVYAYGPPAAMSPFLRRATRGLITTIVNGHDVVPSLSLGILHDMHTVSVAFKSDVSGTKSHVQGRVWNSLRQSIVNKFYVNEPPIVQHAGDGIGEDAWAWKTLKMLREEMLAPKLMPPGEVFVVETMRVLQRDAFTSGMGDDGHPRLGRPATRVQLKFIRDVESVFGEMRFGSGMFSDHNPARYEASLAALSRGILDD
ncbi:Lipase class 3 [Aspergillus parasiticus SU-1]|uniref:sn-1-specific diacylglycerol lipase n=1 Tax=Aspergillus parasiticus (strain ATCC 56775 / NRRL 5862 / SRRC 143 / SU-1) TaxID=1403190 RepID=A0A0F0IKX1_ASPPU|nr:Lipase class 3 [Aspergillus parasiticus SU-1]